MSQQDGTSIERLREIASRRWRLGVAVALLIFAAGGGFVLGLRKVYRATATVLVIPEAAHEGQPPTEIEGRLHVVGQEILSRTNLTALIERFDLYPEMRGRLPQEMVLTRFRNDVSVELKDAPDAGGRGRTVAFAVSYRGTDRSKVADVTNALADGYVGQEDRLRSGTVKALEAQVNQMKSQLDEQEKRLGAARVRHAGDLGAQLDMGYASVEHLNSQIQAAADNRMRAMERRASLLKQIGDTAPTGAGDVDAVSARLSKLNQELAELRRRFTDKYPDVMKLKAEIAALEQQAVEARRRPRAEVDSSPSAQNLAAVKEALREAEEEIRALRDEENTLRGQLDGARRRAGTNPAAGQAWLEQSRDYETTKSLYTSLLKRYEEARLQASSGEEASKPAVGRPLRVLEQAMPPSLPVAPRRLRLLMGVAFLALAAAFGVIVLTEHADNTFHSVDEVRGFTRVPVLVSIPKLMTDEDSRRRGRKRFLAAAALLTVAVLLGQTSYRLAHGNDAAVLSKGRS